MIAGALVAALSLGGCAPSTTETVTEVTEAPAATATEAPPAETATGEPEPSPTATEPSAEDVAKVDAITVTGPEGSEPEVQFETPLAVSFPTMRLVTPGTGEALEPGQLLTVHSAWFRGDTGEEVLSTWVDQNEQSFTFGSPQFQFLNDIFEGANVGARGLVVLPSADPEGNPVSLIRLYEVTGIREVLSRAEGTAMPQDAAEGLPMVTLAANGEPSIDIPADFEPSDELIVRTLIEGDGAEVMPDSGLTVHYTGWLTDGTVFDSSWAGGTPAEFPLTMVIPGWQQGLAGQHVGSQVLLVIPPELGYGDSTQIPTIPPGSTLIFVVDILDVH